MRIVYNQSKLVEFPKNPFELFSSWFKEASTAEREVNGFCLSTCDQNRISSRIVLLKSFDTSGFIFYTNYNSKKAQQLAANPFCAMNFWWGERQIRIEGVAEKISEQESIDYFLSRPKASQIGAWVSQQSTIIKDRSILDQAEIDFTKRFETEPIFKPDYWVIYN